MTRLLSLHLLVVGMSLSQSPPAPEPSAKPSHAILLEVSLPPPGVYEKNKEKLFQPVVGKTNLTKYADRGEGQKKLRELIHQAQVLLWATSPAAAPKPFAAVVVKARKELKATLPLTDRIPIPMTPAAEKRLKEQVFTTSKQLARLVSTLEQMVDELKEAEDLRGKETSRWQANYDLVLAWLQHRIVHLEEHGLALGSLRKELPPYEAAVHKAWRLVSHEKLRDFAGKKRAREGEKLLQKLIKEHPDTVWADLAQQALKTPLGVEWQASK